MRMRDSSREPRLRISSIDSIEVDENLMQAIATEPRLMELGAAVVFMGYGRLESFIADAVAALEEAREILCPRG